MATQTRDPREVCERIKCACEKCKSPCRHMPGALIPGDLERIAKHQGVEVTDEWVVANFLASSGAKVLLRGEVTSVPSIVPEQKPDGSCIFLNAEGGCSIHGAAPFCCSYTAVCDKISEREALRASRLGVNAQIEDLMADGEHTQKILLLLDAGKIADPIEFRRANFEADLKEVEYGQKAKDGSGA